MVMRMACILTPVEPTIHLCSATTHTDLQLRARTLGITVTVIHNASIMNAVGACGLQLYRFGEVRPLLQICCCTPPSAAITPHTSVRRFHCKRQRCMTGYLHCLLHGDVAARQLLPPNTSQQAAGPAHALPAGHQGQGAHVGVACQGKKGVRASTLHEHTNRGGAAAGGGGHTASELIWSPLVGCLTALHEPLSIQGVPAAQLGIMTKHTPDWTGGSVQQRHPMRGHRPDWL